MTPGVRPADVAWTQVRELLAGPRVAVLPVGAAAKEHGPHLPMNTDYVQAEALGARLAQCAPVLVWPTLGYGHYPAFVDYPGSTSAPFHAMRDTVAGVLAGLERAGAPALLVINTGISTIRPIEAAMDEVSAPVALVNVYASDAHRASRAILEQARGGHADEAETSVMLALQPERVNMDRAEPWLTPMPPGRWSPTVPTSPCYCPPGVFGDPTLATAKKGEALLTAMLDELQQAVRDVLARV
ncbi:MAG: creatininase family protein [Sandaracinaceae bacterium]